jgi:hypothetical protein
LLLFLVQVLGLPLGFGCLCGGDLRLVTEAVCHAEACHLPSGHHEEHSHDGAPCDQTDHDHEHLIVTDSLLMFAVQQAKLPPASFVALAPAPSISAKAPFLPEVPGRANDPRCCRPPPEIALKRSVVLLV